MKTILDTLYDVPEAVKGEYHELVGKFVPDRDGIDVHSATAGIGNDASNTSAATGEDGAGSRLGCD